MMVYHIIDNIMNMNTNVERMTGNVKWFNNKAGFGFITGCDGVYKGKDIFVHYSSILVENPQYKYLVQGEYVDFDLVRLDSDKHEFHAVNVTGVKGGHILCETRVSLSDTRKSYQTNKPSESHLGYSETPRRTVSNRGHSNVGHENTDQERFERVVKKRERRNPPL